MPRLSRTRKEAVRNSDVESLRTVRIFPLGLPPLPRLGVRISVSERAVLDLVVVTVRANRDGYAWAERPRTHGARQIT